jgi:hypothetical protein
MPIEKFLLRREMSKCTPPRTIMQTLLTWIPLFDIDETAGIDDIQR